MLPKSIIILSGPIGAGKSTVARALVDAATEPLACIEGDIFRSFLAKKPADQNRAKHFKTVMTSMTAAALPYASAGIQVIVDFSIPPWFLDTACKIAGFRSIPLDYVVLYPSESICATRAANRTEGKILDYSPCHHFYLDFKDAGPNAIRDDQSDPQSLAALIRKGIDAGRFRVR